MYATFQDDRIGVLLRDQIGLDRLMWASDFPHSDSTWPHSREVIERDFEGVPEREAGHPGFGIDLAGDSPPNPSDVSPTHLGRLPLER